MKRPMILAGTASLIISAAYCCLPQSVPFLFILIIGLCATAFFLKRICLRSVLPLLLILLLVFISGEHSKNRINALQDFSGEITVDGIITDVSPQESSVFYTVKSQSINGRRERVNISLLSYEEFYACVGDRIEFCAEKYKDGISPYGNEINLKEPTVLSLRRDKNVYSLLDDLRKNIRNLFFDNMPYDNAVLSIGVLLGDKSSMSETLAENIRRSGVSHIVVASGMHLAIITNAFFRLIGGRKNKFIYSLLGIICVSAFILLTGVSPSILRAALMYYIIFFGLLFARRADALNSLFASAVVLAIINPFIAGNFSFQLSFSATFGVIAVAPVLQNTLRKEETVMNRIMRVVVDIVSTSLSATLLTAPFLIFRFGSFALVSVVTNLLITHLSSILLSVNMFAVLTGAIPVLQNVLCAVGSVCAELMLYVINSLGELPFALITVKNPLVLTAVTAALALAVSAYCVYKYDEIKLGDNYARIA